MQLQDKSKSNLSIKRKYDLSVFDRVTVITAGIWRRMICKKNKPPVGGSSVDGNTMLMRKVREELDWVTAAFLSTWTKQALCAAVMSKKKTPRDVADELQRQNWSLRLQQAQAQPVWKKDQETRFLVFNCPGKIQCDSELVDESTATFCFSWSADVTQLSSRSPLKSYKKPNASISLHYNRKPSLEAICTRNCCKPNTLLKWMADSVKLLICALQEKIGFLHQSMRCSVPKL